MKTTYLIPALVAFGIGGCSSLENSGNDWQGVSLPENLASQEWQLDEQLSDDFNYVGKNETFYAKWVDQIKWKGPGATYFSKEHSRIDNGQLVLKAGPVPANKQGKVIDYGNFETKKTIHTGYVTSKQFVQYPIYMEASLKVGRTELASNFWLLSKDSVYEIDVTETYGNTDKELSHMATNYHVFDRHPTKGILGDFGHVGKKHTTDDKALLNEDFHRFGLYWKTPTHLEFYLDGKLVRTLTDKNDLKDPSGRFFEDGLRVIFDMEDHVWRANKGITPTLEQLNDDSVNQMYVDWFRAYRPVK